MFGFGLGFGTADCDNCGDSESGLAYDAHIGVFLNPRLALMFDLSGWYDSMNDVSLTLSSNTLAAQYWVLPQVWVKGGIGMARATISDSSFSSDESGLGLTGGAGYEILQNGSFALDVGGRLNILNIKETSFTILNFTIGARWK